MSLNLDGYSIIYQNQLDDICDYSSSCIFDTLEKISLLSNLYIKCRIKITPPFATNFRDALFHYKKLYEADTVEDAIEQKEAIDEHLSRALKDCILQLVHILVSATTILYNESDLDELTKKELQKIIHNLKQAILKLRINSMDIVRVSQDDFGIITEICDCILLCSNNEKIKSKWLDICSRYVKKIEVHISE